MKKCVYEKAMILIRNPFYALVAEFQRQMSGDKTAEIDPTLFKALGNFENAMNLKPTVFLKVGMISSSNTAASIFPSSKIGFSASRILV